MLTIKNKQKKVDVDTRFLIRQTKKIVASVGYPSFDLGIWLTTDEQIQKYNKKYRGKNCPTDILSFPFYQELPKTDDYLDVESRDEENLGDLIISVEQVERQAKELNQSFNDRLITLVIHGVCHLLGYTHDKDEEYDEMQEKEQEILEDLKG